MYKKNIIDFEAQMHDQTELPGDSIFYDDLHLISHRYRRVLPLTEEKDILEIGAGSTIAKREISKLSKSYIGLDISKDNIERCLPLQKKYEIKPKIFIQINIGGESQKSGISVENLLDFFHACKKLDLNIIGTMCLPPIDKDPEIFFSNMLKINNDLKLKELSMGMSEDYLKAVEYYSTYLRVGSKIFGPRS